MPYINAAHVPGLVSEVSYIVSETSDVLAFSRSRARNTTCARDFHVVSMRSWSHPDQVTLPQVLQVWCATGDDDDDDDDDDPPHPHTIQGHRSEGARGHMMCAVVSMVESKIHQKEHMKP